MSPNQIVNAVERTKKGLKVICIYEYKGEYLVTYSINGIMNMDPYYLVSKDGKAIRPFNFSSNPSDVVNYLNGKSPVYLK